MGAGALGRQKRIGEVVGGRGARVYRAAQVGSPSCAETRRAQAVMRNGHLQQRERASVGRLWAPSKRRALDDDLEGAGLVADGGGGVVVGGGE